MSNRTCSVAGCERQYHGHGMCAAHRLQVTRRGEVVSEQISSATTPEERFNRSYWIDESTGCWNWTAFKSDRGYGMLSMDGTRRAAHRFSYERSIGAIPPGMVIDHKCRNRACVNPGHLQVATFRQNSENVDISSANTSGVRGVSWDRVNRKWFAYATSGGRRYWAGRHATLADAERAAIAKRNELHTNNLLDQTV